MCIFFCDDSTVLDVACTLAGLGFPWNKLGKLYVEEILIFERKPEFLGSKFNGLLDIGFSNEQAVGICLGFPCLLKGDEVGLSSEFDEMLDELKRVFVDFDLGSYGVGNVDVWYELCRKIRVFYDLGVEKGKVVESIGKSECIFVDYSEKILSEKMEFLCKLGVGKTDVGLLLLAYPEILSIDFDRVLSVKGFLFHFGLLKKEVETLLQNYPYVFGQNKMINLPHILRAMDLHHWFFDKLKCNLLANYALSSPDDGKDEDYAKILFALHGSANNLQERFDFLLNEGIEFSKLCKMIVRRPRILNQERDSLKQKLGFLRHEVGLSLNILEKHTSLLLVNFENQIKARYRFFVWLTKQGWCNKTYSATGIISDNRKGFMTKLARIHPNAPQLWLEQFEQKKDTSSKS